MEQLDHRQLLAVTFTGNVTNDFTAATPAAYLSDPANQVPLIPGNLQVPGDILTHVSGFQVDKIAVNYNQATDTLSVGFLQPASQLPGNPTAPVIAGDADDNGLDPNNLFNPNPQIPDNSTTAPGVQAAQPGFVDSPGISGEEHFFAVLDLSGGTNTASQSLFAGIPQQTATPGYPFARYVVAPAVYTSGLSIDSVNPQPGGELSANEGNIYLGSNDPRHGAFEFQITHFSQLYQQITGKALTGTSVIDLGASAGSGSDGGISEEVFHFQPLTISNATTVPPPPPPPIVVPIEVFQPTILINPHQNRHVNTAHYDNIRVTVLSSSSFAATEINPLTVRLNGAPPVSWFPKIALHDGFVSETFVFKGTDVTLPPGFTVATITGATNTGQTFTSSEIVFNRGDSFYNAAQIASRDRRLARLGIPVAQENATATAAAVAPATTATPAALTGALPLDSTVGSTTTVKLTPRQQYAAAAAARKAGLYSTAAATSFTGSSTTNPATTPTAPAQTAAMAAYDAALASLGGKQSAA